jgi:hypothetical protein
MAGPAMGAEKAAASTELKAIPCSSDAKRIVVSGLDGSVLYPNAETTFDSGETLCIEVRPANLISYRYQLEVDDEEIEIYYPIVGGPGPESTNKAAQSLVERQDTQEGPAPPKDASDFLEQVKKLIGELQVARTDVPKLAEQSRRRKWLLGAILRRLAVPMVRAAASGHWDGGRSPILPRRPRARNQATPRGRTRRRVLVLLSRRTIPKSRRQRKQLMSL